MPQSKAKINSASEVWDVKGRFQNDRDNGKRLIVMKLRRLSNSGDHKIESIEAVRVNMLDS